MEKLPELKPCPECGGERVWGLCTGDFYIRTTGLIRGAFDMKNKITEARAAVCTTCGHTTLYAVDPQKLVVKRFG